MRWPVALAAAYAVPLYRIHADTLYDAGLQQGRAAAAQIHGWLASEEMRGVLAYARGPGRGDFEKLKAVNSAEFPEYVEELRGLAAGANVTLDEVWASNLVMELEGLNSGQADHCSDLHVHLPDGTFVHGHNEDWSAEVKPFVYYSAYESRAAGAAPELNCAGLGYPAAVVGYGPAWNKAGLFATQNALHPRDVAPGGLAQAFVQRRALCRSTDVPGFVARLTVPGWSAGASMNVVDVRSRTAANVEIDRNRSSAVQLGRNYSHFNMYKHPGMAGLGEKNAEILESSHHRQARVDALPAPVSVSDVRRLLSDTHDPSFPLYHADKTITSLVLTGDGALRVWAGAPAVDAPLYTWNLHTFFEPPFLVA